MPTRFGDMDPEEFRRAAHRVADQVADYLADLERFPVLPDLLPGQVREQLPPSAPRVGEPMDAILDDYARLIEPNVTHWQHPGFLAYFASVASGPGILGEWLAAGLNSNVMLWRNAPASTELEETVVAWLRDLLGLPEAFDGMFTDTASISSLLSLVAARHALPGLEATERGLAGREGIGRLRLYGSAEMHASIDKGAIVAGVGREGIRRIPVDADYRMRADLLARAVEEDRRAGFWPFCVVATLGTTSSTSVDPVEEIAGVCAREGLWLHLDAAYGGAAALLPEMRGLFAGWERADSIVVNPHKWMWIPFDASLLLFRRPEAYRGAFGLVPEYLRTPETGATHNYSEYGVQLGRRFRALKVWFVLRWFGAEGMAERLRAHLRLARELAGWVEVDPDWELLAPVPFATVCLRWRGRGRSWEEATLDAANERILARVNASGRIFLSHTRLDGRFTIRVSIGNPRTTAVHVRLCWDLLREAAEGIGGTPGSSGIP